MTTNENLSKHLYVKETREWVPVSDEIFNALRRETDACIHKMRSRKCCCCPKSKWWLCNMDCWTCEFRCGDEFISLDAPISSNEAENITIGDSYEDDAPDFESIICDVDELNHLQARLDQFVPEARQVGELRLAGLSDEKIAGLLGVKRTTLLSRLKKAKRIFADDYPEWF